MTQLQWIWVNLLYFFLSKEMLESLSTFQFVLVARTAYGRPPFFETRKHLEDRCNFKGNFILSALDNKHLLLRFPLHDDYLKLLLYETLYVHGKLFQFFKWTDDFTPGSDPTVIPIWIEFPVIPH